MSNTLKTLLSDSFLAPEDDVQAIASTVRTNAYLHKKCSEFNRDLLEIAKMSKEERMVYLIIKQLERDKEAMVTCYIRETTGNTQRGPFLWSTDIDDTYVETFFSDWTKVENINAILETFSSETVSITIKLNCWRKVQAIVTIAV